MHARVLLLTVKILLISPSLCSIIPLQNSQERRSLAATESALLPTRANPGLTTKRPVRYNRALFFAIEGNFALKSWFFAKNAARSCYRSWLFRAFDERSSQIS